MRTTSSGSRDTADDQEHGKRWRVTSTLSVFYSRV